MRVPRISHIQFVVLACLQGGAMTGKELRAALGGAGLRRSGPSFYQIMSRLEDANLVAGAYQQEVVAGQIVRERRYQITATGRRACRDTREFYLAWLARLDGGLPA